MNPRTTWRWLLSAALLFAFIFIHHRFLRKPDPGPQKILPTLQPALVSSIEILRPANKIEIAVERTGAQWRLTRPLSYAAHSVDIEALLSGLAGLLPSTTLGAAELKNRPEADEEFGFANPQASIVI